METSFHFLWISAKATLVFVACNFLICSLVSPFHYCLPPVFAGRAYVPSLQYWTRMPANTKAATKYVTLTSPDQEKNLPMWIWVNGEKSKCGGGRMLLLILRAGRSAAGKTLQRCCLKTINCPLMPPLSTHFVYNSANWIIIEVHHHA